MTARPGRTPAPAPVPHTGAHAGTIPGSSSHRQHISGLTIDKEINGRVAEDWEWAIRLRVYEQERVKDAALVATCGPYKPPVDVIALVRSIELPWGATS